jgi:hypothetical protein
MMEFHTEDGTSAGYMALPGSGGTMNCQSMGRNRQRTGRGKTREMPDSWMSETDLRKVVPHQGTVNCPQRVHHTIACTGIDCCPD